MPNVFAVLTSRNDMDVRLEGVLKSEFPSDFYVIGRGQWLVAFEGTAKELYEKISPAESPFAGTVVFGVGGYFGRASRDMWEWIANKLGATS